MIVLLVRYTYSKKNVISKMFKNVEIFLAHADKYFTLCSLQAIDNLIFKIHLKIEKFYHRYLAKYCELM